jgi:hypothetical protein
LISDEWEYETSAPTTIPAKETPRTIPSYKEVPEVVYITSKEPVYKSGRVSLSGDVMGTGKGEYTWGEVGCEEKMEEKKGGGDEGKGEKKDEVKKDEVKKDEVKKDEVKKEKEEKGLKKADVDKWRNSVTQEANPAPESSEQGKSQPTQTK